MFGDDIADRVGKALKIRAKEIERLKIELEEHFGISADSLLAHKIASFLVDK